MAPITTKEKRSAPDEGLDSRYSSPYEGSTSSASPRNMTPKKRKRNQSTAEEIEIDIAAPEPPSKKALRKAKKIKPTSALLKVARPQSGIAQERVMANSDDERLEPSRPANQPTFGIWIGNLPFTTTKATLQNFFTENSSIKAEVIIRIHLPAPREGSRGPGLIAAGLQRLKPQNKGFAYVDFKTTEAMKAALALSETLLSGRRVLIKDAKSFEGRPEKPKDGVINSNGVAATSVAPNNRIFVGNLGYDVSQDDLSEHYSRCGKIKGIHMATFEDSGKCKGFAWIEFEDVEAAESVIKGWVRIPVEKLGDDTDIEFKDAGKSSERNKKTQKWFVNRLRGRLLRTEFAEDKAVRYKKRYGKDEVRTTSDGKSDRVMNGESTSETRDVRPFRNGSLVMKRPQKVLKRRTEETSISPGRALAGAPRLTGGIVSSQGKKTVF